jgi:type I restriction enzyme, S subunit
MKLRSFVEWQESTLRAVCEPTHVWNPHREPRDEFWYIDVSAVSRESLSIREPQRVKGTDAPSRARKLVKSGDTIYATVRPTLRRIAFIGHEFDDQIASTAFCVLRPNKDSVAPRFLYYALQTDAINEEIARFESGASYPAVNDTDVLNRTLLLPPKSEQEKIATALRKIQRTIEVEERLTATARELKQAAMRHLFTRGLRGESQQETEIGPIPESWRLVRLGEICSLSTGTTPSTKNLSYYNGDVPFIKTFEVVNNRIARASNFVSEEAVSDYNLRIYSPGTILMAMYGQGKTRGQVSLLEIPAATTQNAAAIEPDDRISGEFLWQYLLSIYERLRGLGSLGHLSHLNLGYMRELAIICPPREEQDEIAFILNAIDRKIIVHESKSTALQDLFKTMLHKLMTGEIRIADLDIDTSEVMA